MFLHQGEVVVTGCQRNEVLQSRGIVWMYDGYIIVDEMCKYGIIYVQNLEMAEKLQERLIKYQCYVELDISS